MKSWDETKTQQKGNKLRERAENAMEKENSRIEDVRMENKGISYGKEDDAKVNRVEKFKGFLMKIVR